MGDLSTLEALILGAIAILVVLWFRPGIRQIFRESAEAEERDWVGLLIPVALVALFVILLIVLT